MEYSKLVSSASGYRVKATFEVHDCKENTLVSPYENVSALILATSTEEAEEIFLESLRLKHSPYPERVLKFYYKEIKQELEHTILVSSKVGVFFSDPEVQSGLSRVE